MKIDPTAIIDPSARLGRDVVVGPFATIGPHVVVGDECSIGQGAIVAGHTQLGARNQVFPCVALGTAPQDLKYHGEETRLVIGDENVFREFTTVNIGTVTGHGVTTIGSNCFIMACAHIAHDCTLEDQVILANSVLLGGHVSVQRDAKLMGNASVNPFATIGRLAYVGGLTRIVQDVPPFTIVEGHPAKVRNINVIGCERAGIAEATVSALKDGYKKIFRAKELNRTKILDEVINAPDVCPEVAELATFMKRSLTGKSGRYLESLR